MLSSSTKEAVTPNHIAKRSNPMPETPMTIAPFYKGWDDYQQRLVQAVAPLTLEQLAQGVARELRPIGMLIAHIIVVRAGWLHFNLLERDERLLEFIEWNEWEYETRPASELVRGLEVTWAVIEAGLNRWTVADLDDVIWDTNEAGEPVIALMRQWVIWHLIEHDMHHGGELSYSLGIHHLAGIEI
jgi:uncharacterized damage-inducible protein DinB